MENEKKFTKMDRCRHRVSAPKVGWLSCPLCSLQKALLSPLGEKNTGRLQHGRLEQDKTSRHINVQRS